MGQLVEDVDRDREFEERRLKIEREQELIYEQEEQHFREVVKSFSMIKDLNQFSNWVNPYSLDQDKSGKSSQKYLVV